MGSWKTGDSAELYQIDSWSGGYFTVNPRGHVEATPNGDGRSCDLYDLVRKLDRRGISAPILIRFDQIIDSNVARIQDAFAAAIDEAGYEGGYHLAYPIKVNQQFHVVESVRRAGKRGPLALEVGSKPELLAVMAIHDEPGALLICNGYKDIEYIELAVMAAKLGRRPIIVIEQLDEVELVLQVARALDTPVELGLRMKPTSKGAGRWDESAGEKAKFGLNTSELLQAVALLEQGGARDWLRLLHFHVGSQITAIGAMTRVLREATRVYAELKQICPSLSIFDAGGGLGVDYDGSRTSFHSSVNYTVAEYAQEVVYAMLERCRETGIEQPELITESGRATVAHHAVLVVEATDMAPALDPLPDLADPPGRHQLLVDLAELLSDLSVKNVRETLHETLVMRDDVLEQFVRGDLSLAQRAWAERVLRHLVARLHELAGELKRPLPELEKLESELDDQYFCNFSIFQSIPDSWAIDQLFPVMPIHRLGEEPTRQAVLADLTCDSDGKIDTFIDVRGTRRSLRLHPVDPRRPYYLGIFLVGAYQEILGDLHNLFGDTNAAHVHVDEDGEPHLTAVVRGDTMQQVLEYVQFTPAELFERLRLASERALRAGTMDEHDTRRLERRYREALGGYTYLVKEDAESDAIVAPGRDGVTSNRR